MPTCVSIDNCVCHFSPLASEQPIIIKNGQVVKFDLGAHIDGYIASVAHTVVVGSSKVRIKFFKYFNKNTKKFVIKRLYYCRFFEIRIIIYRILTKSFFFIKKNLTKI